LTETAVAGDAPLLLPQFHHLTIAFREGAALAGAFQAVLRMEVTDLTAGADRACGRQFI